MQIANNAVVSIHYTVTDTDGNTIDSSKGKDPLVYLHGHRNIIPGLEAALEGKSAKDHVEADIEAAKAYGEINDDLIQEVPRSAFEGVENLEIGMHFQAQTDQGPVNVMISAIEDDMVTVDGNHRLAGKALNFVVDVVEVRAATEEEIAHGHVHGPGGHHH